MIVKATKKHVPFIEAKLAEVENPPYFDSDQIEQEILLNPTEYTFVDTTNKTLCRFSINKTLQQIDGVWLLPASKPKRDLFPILRRTFLAIYNEHPEVRTWRVWAAFATGRGCLKNFTSLNDGKRFCKEWAQFFPGAMVQASWKKFHWEISFTLGEAATKGINVGIDGTI